MSHKLQQLTSHILSQKLCRNENIDSWVDRLTFPPESRDMGEYSEICQQHSTCTLFIERFVGDSREIIAQITAWLQENDKTREQFGLPDPEMDVTMLNKSGTSWDVDVSIEFYDPVMVKRDPAGRIQWQGDSWSLISEPLVDTAQEVAQVDPEGKANG